MVINIPKKFCYISPPKTASGVLGFFFLSIDGSEARVQHQWKLPISAVDHDCDVIMSVRDPFERLQSFHTFLLRPDTESEFLKRRFNMIVKENFTDFIYDVVIPNSKINQVANLYVPLKKYYDNTNPKYIIRYESLKEDLKALPFNQHGNWSILDEPINKSGKIDTAEFYQDKKRVQAVLDYCEEDFELFGYDKGRFQ